LTAFGKKRIFSVFFGTALKPSIIFTYTILGTPKLVTASLTGWGLGPHPTPTELKWGPCLSLTFSRFSVATRRRGSKKQHWTDVDVLFRMGWIGLCITNTIQSFIGRYSERLEFPTLEWSFIHENPLFFGWVVPSPPRGICLVPCKKNRCEEKCKASMERKGYSNEF